MKHQPYEIPRTLVSLLKLVGPLQEEAAGGYHYSISVVLRDDTSPAGFLIEQRIAESSIEIAKSEGFQFMVPNGPAAGGEATYVFLDSLQSALDFIKRPRSGGRA